MQQNLIEHPKVFISYAWGTDEYQERVMAFATDLTRSGIDVQFDKWDLKEGHDTYSYMEQCATDPSITNVLLLLDENYARKADTRSGGVGAETQIISPEIYSKVKQEKFIPIIFARGDDGSISKPTYLKGILHFDLSISDRYADEYQRLVRRLYGKEIFQKPEIGSKPDWVDHPPSKSYGFVMELDTLKNPMPARIRSKKLIDVFARQNKDLIDFEDIDKGQKMQLDEYLAHCVAAIPIRDGILQIYPYLQYIDEGYQIAANALEEIVNALRMRRGLAAEIRLSIVHELFIYLVAYLFKANDYGALAYVLGKTYFISDYSTDREYSFDVFYTYNENLHNAMNARDKKSYHCGMSRFWTENIYAGICSTSEFAFSDLLCFNYSLFGKSYHGQTPWFPLSYPYSGDNDRTFRLFASKLKSQEHLNHVLSLMGYQNADEFVVKFKEVEEALHSGKLSDYRFGGAFESPHVLCNYIKVEDIGKFN